MILIYIFVAFLFFKIFPEFAGYQSNTVIGALVMAVVSGMVLKAGEVAAAWRIGTWLQMPPRPDGDAPVSVLVAAVASIAVSMGATFLVGVGFSDRMMRSAFMGFRPDPLLFWVMAALPPLAHVGAVAPRYWRSVTDLMAARKGQ